MTVKELFFRMARSDCRRYLLYGWGNVLSVALFTALASLYTNADFMNEHLVDPLISSNIIAPSFFTAVFMVFFVPYSYGAFFRKRCRAYGILLTLGSSEGELLLAMIAENLLISIVSLGVGLVLGTALALAFLEILRHLLGLTVVHIRWPGSAWALAAALYGILVAVTLVMQVLAFAKAQITTMLKIKGRGERLKGSPLPRAAAGILLWAAAATLLMTVLRKNTSLFLLLAAVLILAGCWLLLPALFRGLHRRAGLEPGDAFAAHHFRSWRVTTFLGAGLITVTLFLAGLTVANGPNLMANAASSSPYDLLYIEAGGNNTLSVATAKELLSTHNVKVEDSVEIPYQRNGVFNLFPAEELNVATHSHYHVAEGTYIAVYQYDPDDGYLHERNVHGSLRFPLAEGMLSLAYGGEETRILFNSNPGFADATLVLNDADYERIAGNGSDYYSGVVKCFRGADWRTSSRGAAALQQALNRQNHYVDREEQEYFTLSSKWATEQKARQSGGFLLLTLGFVDLLFYFAAVTVIRYKIKDDLDAEKIWYRSLFGIGLGDNELRRLLRRKNRRALLLPLLLGGGWGTFLSFALCRLNGYGLPTVLAGAAISAALLLVQNLIVIMVSNSEEKVLITKTP